MSGRIINWYLYSTSNIVGIELPTWLLILIISVMIGVSVIILYFCLRFAMNYSSEFGDDGYMSEEKRVQKSEYNNKLRSNIINLFIQMCIICILIYGIVMFVIKFYSDIQ